MPRPSLIALALVTSALAAAPAHAAPRFPARLTGTFSGQNTDYAWQAKVTLTRHRRQTIYLYTGRATVTWTLRAADLGDGCRLNPAAGSFAHAVQLQVNRTPDRRRGFSYVSGGSGQGDTGPQRSVCDGEALSNGHGVISGLDAFGGFTKDLRRFAGAARGLTWSLRAS